MTRRITGGGAAALAAAAVVLACNGGLGPATSCPGGRICGTVTFQGAEPDSTEGVFILAYDTFPQSRAELFNFQPPLPLRSLARPFSGSKAYSITVPNGTYQWVLAVWQKQGMLTPTNADTLLRETGFYRDAGDTTSHGSGIVTVNAAAGADSIDFVIDFNNMHRVCDYFKPCP
jgi:hypothetical protein